MSSILKALKKLEDEKTSRFPDSLNIDSDILKSSHESRKVSPLTALLLLLLVFGGGAGAAYVIMKGNTQQHPAVAAKAQPDAVVTVHPATPVIPRVNKPVQPVVKAAAPVQKKPSAMTAQKPPQKKVAAVTAQPPVAKTLARATVQHSSDKPLPPADNGAKNELPVSPAMPVLRVNGIAFQNSSADSMAIINGIPVSSGSTVDGATVAEIRRDRVVFQKGGEKFEVRLGQANR